jgi:molybdate transport system ATP-binding protein
MSVWRNLRYGFVRARSGKTSITVDSVIELLGLRPLLERRPSQLSGGEQQRVALGRALLAQPRLLLLDEPLASIDLARREEVLPYLEKLRDALRIPMVYVSHQFDEILRLADYVVLLDQGQATAQGTMTGLSLRPELRGIVGPEAVGAVIDAQVSSLDAANGLARIAVGQGTLQVEATHLAVGQRVRLQLLARDLIIATETPRGLSVRNVLPAVVRGTNADDSGSVLVHLHTGDVPLLARVTTLAAQELALRAGMQVWVLVKSVTLRGHVFAGPSTT